VNFEGAILGPICPLSGEKLVAGTSSQVSLLRLFPLLLENRQAKGSFRRWLLPPQLVTHRFSFLQVLHTNRPNVRQSVAINVLHVPGISGHLKLLVPRGILRYV